MDTPIWFSGSSPDAAFAREDQWRRERTGVLEGDRNARAQASSQSFQAFLNNQQQEDQLREQDLNRNWQSQEAAARSGEFARQFDANLAYSRNAADEQRPLMQANIADIKARTAATNAAVENSKLLPAQAAADQGMILDPNDAVTTFGVDLNTAKRLHAASKAAQDRIDKQDAELATAASELTRFATANSALKALNLAPVSDVHWWSGKETEDAKAKHDADIFEQTRIIDQLKPRINFLTNPKRQDALNQLDSDPATGAYIYNPPPRPWRQKASAPNYGNMGGGWFPPAPPAKVLTPAIAAQYRQRYGGRAAAEAAAKADGFTW